ncbi:MAG: GIY-YIG nuclease family protein [Nitrososphaerota archaeon]|nr:GIY-YIG nuclease family protein [Nitrososphaerota archaeon]
MEGTDSGLYQLVIRLKRKQSIGVGRLGRFAFPSGYYVYTGSARRGLESRIARHLRKEKRLRWHVDYVLRYGDIAEVPFIYRLYNFAYWVRRQLVFSS